LGGEVGGSAAKIGNPKGVVCLPFFVLGALNPGGSWREQKAKTDSEKWFRRAPREGQLSVAPTTEQKGGMA